MHYKTNRLNHDFQIAYFLAGSCHTPDAAYALLCDLREDRETALRMAEASKLRAKARRIRAERVIEENADEVLVLEAQAELSEMEATADMVQRNEQAAIAELAFIDKCMAKLEPLRKYAHLPLPQAHEAAQAEEWKLELLHRAENSLLTAGNITPEILSTMRMHPEFNTSLLPALEEMRSAVARGRGKELLTKEPRLKLSLDE